MTLLGDRGQTLGARYHYRGGASVVSLRGLEVDPMGNPIYVAPSADDIRPWDPSLTTTSGRQPVQNNGCPDGYFAQFVAIGEPGAVAVPGRGYALRCRLMASSTPETIAHESGISTSEAIAVYTDAIKDTARQVGQAGARLLSWTPWLVLGLGAIAAWSLARRVV